MSQRSVSEPAGLSFPGRPGLELDQLLGQLVERAQEVIGTQGRLRGLLRATQAVTGGLAVPVLLRRIVEAGRELVGAQYAALGVVGPDGRLTEFVHTGMDEETVARIGRLPEGKGLLGAVIEDPRPIRLTRLQDDPRSAGFPEGHPPMTGFLGVPVRARGAVFGNLYFACGDRGPFTEEDEQLALALAAAAGSAIENARLCETARNQQEWLRASAVVTRELLSPDAGDPWARVVEYVRDLAAADLVSVVCPGPDPGTVRVERAIGAGADQLRGIVVPADSTVAGIVLASGEPRMGSLPDERSRLAVPSAVELNVDAVLLVPFTGGGQVTRVLTVARLGGRPAFTGGDLEIAVWFADQASVAMELAAARAEREAEALHDERDRIAAELHYEILRRLYAIGLSLQTTAGLVRSPAVAARLKGTIADLDDIIGHVQDTVFQLDDAASAAPEPVRDQVLRVLSEAAARLGFAVSSELTGKFETIPCEAVIPFLTEALRLVALHAAAEEVAVEVRASGELVTAVVRYEGTGDVAGTAAGELAVLAEQAKRRGGTFRIAGGAVAGDGELRWAVPVERGSSPPG
ncbi:GAF domain-containing protein [Amycolatopsis sulphurea]|uniref:GAF domain-containing protein n=1 Tax=Amycolatopsis sulphurea TaxID=76022 RepID=A0A2A9G337_9PSEU|nr:GAF domain-containing protein [Amycolatopsis sulphurea]PFG57220.1 GAF domain-containing protein [Amycolatopsis sulphurea]